MRLLKRLSLRLSLSVGLWFVGVAYVAADVSVFFSPLGGCERAIVLQVAKARQSIHVEAYQFTDSAIAFALIEARARGVDVMVITDGKHPGAKTLAPVLLAHAIPVFRDKMHTIFHNKVMIIDRAIVITGSFNFTTAAEKRNAENVIIMRDTDAAARFLTDFAQHKAHSIPW